GMRSYLSAAGLDVEQETERRALALTSDQSHLIDGEFDTDRMLEMLDRAVWEARCDGYSGLWASGDMTWEFGNERNFVKLLDYDRKLETLFDKHPTLSGVCQYHADTLPVGVVEHGCHVHPGVYVNETLSRINPYFLSHDTLAERRKAPVVPLKCILEQM